MTLEELKKEANEQGYYLVRKQGYIRLEKCKCGRYPGLWFSPTGKFYRCDSCGVEAPLGRSTAEAKKAWNRMIREGE